MNISSPAIVISSFKYGEADLIVKLYVKSLGLQSFIIKGVRKTRKGKLRVSYFQPLTLLDIETVFKGKGTLEYIKEARVSTMYVSLHSDIIKSSIAMFFSELLTQLLVDQHPDEELYEYLEAVFLKLDQNPIQANFPIKVLLDITTFLGFNPDYSTAQNTYFNLLDGTFDNLGMLPQHATEKESENLKKFLGIIFEDSAAIKMNREDRNLLLNMIIDYLQIHLNQFKKPESLSILNQLFN